MRGEEGVEEEEEEEMYNTVQHRLPTCLLKTLQKKVEKKSPFFLLSENMTMPLN